MAAVFTHGWVMLAEFGEIVGTGFEPATFGL
jgi:hypothetical protein